MTRSRGRFSGLHFQKRIRLFPGLHLNLSRSGIGVSAGGRGFHVGVTARGQRYVSAGIPGSGLRVRQYSPAKPNVSTLAPLHSPRLRIWPLAISLIILAVLLLAAMRS